MKTLKLANNYSNDQLFGQALVTLQGDAKWWYQSQPADAFTPGEGARDTQFDLLATALRDKFKLDTTPGDVISEVLALKQTKIQTVDEYISLVLKKFDLAPDLSEEMKCSLLIAGFQEEIQDALRLKDLKTVVDLQRWARRVERMSFAKKQKGIFVSTADAEEVRLVKKPVIHTPAVKRPQRQYMGNRRSVLGPCWTCGGPHMQRNCQRQAPDYQSRSQGAFHPGRGYRGQRFIGAFHARGGRNMSGGFGRGHHQQVIINRELPVVPIVVLPGEAEVGNMTGDEV